MINNDEKTEVFNAFIASGFSSKINCSLCTSTLNRMPGTGSRMNPIIQDETVSKLLHHLDTRKCLWPDEIHPRVLRELVEVLTEPLSIIYQQSWLTGEVPADWTLTAVMLTYKAQKDNPGNYSPVSMTLVLWKVIEQTILSVIPYRTTRRSGPVSMGL